MEQYKRLSDGYKQKQVALRGQISALKAGRIRAGGKGIGTDTAAAIRRTERQIADLDRAIARCHGEAQGSR